MTIVIYRDGILAADTEVSCGELRVGTMSKIWVSDYVICGFAGAVDKMQYAKDQFDTTPTMDSFSRFTEGDMLIAINRNNHLIYGVEGKDSTYHRFADKDWHALGSGWQIAFGALAHGATAIEAVEICIKLCYGCGGDIEFIDLKDESPSVRKFI